MMEYVKLYNGVEMPAIMLGPGIPGRPKGFPFFTDNSIPSKVWRKFVSWPLNQRRFIKAVASGIKAGFCGIDFSSAYGYGSWIADAILSGNYERKDVFLTGRIKNSAQFKGADAVKDLIRKMLDEYRTDHFDVLMFHWPVTGCYETTWKVICEAYDQGVTRSIGVANCHRHHLESLMRCGYKPMINQFEIHPLFTQKDFIKYNQDLGIVVQSYTPLARMDQRLFRIPALKKIAGDHFKTEVQTVLRWHIQQGLVPVVRVNNPRHQKESVSVFDFNLSKDEMDIIDGFNIDSRLRYHPDNCDFTIL